MGSTSLEGHFLVAAKEMGDQNFNQSVVLIIQHNDEGAFGVILNRPTNNTVGEIWNMVAHLAADCEQPVYLGGPVSGPLVAVHGLASASEKQVVKDVHFAAHKDELSRVIGQTKKPFRIFTGCAGWGPGQLEGELTRGDWLTLPATAELVFCPPEQQWDHVLRLFGRAVAEQVLAPALKNRVLPDDPRLN